MKNILIKVFAVIAFTLLPQSHATATTLVVLGDSLSAGYGMAQSESWVGILQQRWRLTHPELTLVNASISGDTTQGALNRLPGVMSRHQPDAVFVELGGNDGLRGFLPATIAENLSQIITQLQQNNTKVALSQIYIPPNYGPRYSDMFAEVFPQVAEQTGVALIPFFMETIIQNEAHMQNDGIHPNRDAQPLIADIMEPYLLELIDQLETLEQTGE
ncbi:acyl-CoA thioesterase-1 [Pseudidiomarina indica]|uniref:Acyl-CoA thioesterase-1 n=1 Tax=Pseudidiomarina indica TaxID=1159017 RepID=A0A1G6CAK3_9GAMM|nr:arylesterase [Pseudidiomarina indica]SDB29841.1 acyl-CoA thioesterase-1 [Pseudidiomarina indica]